MRKFTNTHRDTALSTCRLIIHVEPRVIEQFAQSEGFPSGRTLRRYSLGCAANTLKQGSGVMLLCLLARTIAPPTKMRPRSLSTTECQKVTQVNPLGPERHHQSAS